MTIDVKKLRTIAEPAKSLPYSYPSLRSKIEHRELNAVKVGGTVFIEESELRAKFGDIYPPRFST